MKKHTIQLGLWIVVPTAMFILSILDLPHKTVVLASGAFFLIHSFVVIPFAHAIGVFSTDEVQSAPDTSAQVADLIYNGYMIQYGLQEGCMCMACREWQVLDDDYTIVAHGDTFSEVIALGYQHHTQRQDTNLMGV